MNEKKTYYAYQYILGTDDFRISELLTYDNECLDVVDVNISYRDTWTFFMYSESDENMEAFISGIFDMLVADHAAASRLVVTALGRYRTFEDAWRKYSASKSVSLKQLGKDVQHDVHPNLNTTPDATIFQPYSAEAESWFAKRFSKCE